MDDDVFEEDGDCVPEQALSRLLLDEIVFANEREYHFEGQSAGSTVVLFVLCSDLFGSGVGDAEDLPFQEIANLYRMHVKERFWGASKWCCLRRQMRPKASIVALMRECGAWDQALEALPAPPS